MSKAKEQVDESELSDLLCVGDTLVTTTCFGSNEFKITRVTKTLAKSRREDGYEYTFKREISYNMSHPREQWSTTKYTVIKHT